MSEYPLDQRSGYCLIPRDSANFEPLMREPSGVLIRLYLVIHCRVRHRDGWARGSHGNVELKRGQCILGVREVADRLGIGKNAAARGLRELEKLGLIVRDAGQRGSVVTVPNYGVYGESDDHAQDSAVDSLGTAAGTAPGTAAGQLRTPNERENGRTKERKNGIAPAARAVAVEPDEGGVAVLDVPELGTQTILSVYDPEEPTSSARTEGAVCEGLARAVIGWLNGVHRAEGKQANHRGFDPLAKDVLRAAARWRKLKLRPEDVISVCQHRIDGWRAANVDWLNNARPVVLFRAEKFDAALAEWRSGFKPTATAFFRRNERPGVRTAPNEHYRDKGIGECEI